MPKLLKDTASAFGLARKTTNAEEIEAAIGQASTMIADGESEEAAAQARYRDALLADDGDPAAALAEVQAAKIKRDRGEAQIAELTARLTAVREAETRAARKQVHDDAAARCAAVQTRLKTEYPKLATAIRSLLFDLAEAEVARRRAEGEAPEFGLIPSPEALVRGLEAVPEEILDQREVELWVRAGQWQPMPEAQQALVRAQTNSPRRGYMASAPSGSHSIGADHDTCYLQRFVRVRFRESMLAPAADTLWRTISLPALDAYGEDFVTSESFRSVETAVEHLGRPLPPAQVPQRAERVRFEPVPSSPEPDDHAGNVVALERAA